MGSTPMKTDRAHSRGGSTGGNLMESVVLLWHVHQVGGDGDEDSKFIGVYRSEADAVSAIERLKSKPGFAETVEGFTYERYELDSDHWTEGFVEVEDLPSS
jgi:hypothetical protein